MVIIKIIREKISEDEVRELARETFGDMVKVVVDIERAIMAAGGNMHYQAEQVLLKDGSKQKDLWGANIYPDDLTDSRIAYESLINIRPRDGNRFMVIQDDAIKLKVKSVIDSLIGE